MTVQAPVPPVTQLAVPPGEKLPLTVTLAMGANGELTSRTVTAACARQFFPFLNELPERPVTAICTLAGSAAVSVPIEYSSRFGE